MRYEYITVPMTQDSAINELAKVGWRVHSVFNGLSHAHHNPSQHHYPTALMEREIRGAEDEYERLRSENE